MEHQPQRPPNYLAIAIITTIICCLPAGVVSIVYSTKVNSEYDAGNYEAAERASKNAKTWAIVSAVAAVVFGVIYVVFIGGLAFLSAGGNF